MNAQRGNFVLLRAGALRLLLAQPEVGAAEYLEPPPVPTAVAGLLRSADPQDRRVHVALSEQLTPLPACPPGRFVGCELAGGEMPLVWCWDELRVLIDLNFEPIAIPAALLAEGSVVTHYAQVDGAPVFICSAQALCAQVLQPSEGEHAA